MSDKPTTAEQWDRAGIRKDTRPDTKTARPGLDEKPVDERRVNEFACVLCGRVVVTFDRDFGLTTTLVPCEVFGGTCQGMTSSRGYDVDQDERRATWEWFRPQTSSERRKIGRDPRVVEHVKRGGLLLRLRPGVEWPDVETSPCPGCGKAVEDLDGFGVLAHVDPHPTACGYCSHPSRTDGVCGVCGGVEP